MYILEVYVTNASLKVNRPFTYYSTEKVECFCRVMVKFNHACTAAIVVSVKPYAGTIEKLSEKMGFKVMPIEAIIDTEAFLNPKQIELAKWLAKTTISPFIACLNVMLPKALKTSKKISNVKKEIRLTKLSSDSPLTKRQSEVLEKISDGMLLKDANLLSPSIVAKLIKLGYLEKYAVDSEYQNTIPEIQTCFKQLTNDQQCVYDQMLASDKLVSLLFGVTGSGKTEVYLHLARHYLLQDKTVLILVPEIALTPQMIQRVKQRFLDVIFYHSKLNDTERYEQYQRVKKNSAMIVVGTRSTVFLPFNNLGLIILDEEHDSSYKQDSIPMYNTKNVAIKLAMMHKARVLLASATPSLDSYSRALKNDYLLLKLDKRINLQLPEIRIVDLNSELKNKKNYILSSLLVDRIQKTLDAKHQVIILLNRRGYSPIVKCADCGATMMCQDCDMPLSYHQDERCLKCHQCGRTYALVDTCPNCHGHDLIYYGFGTKKVEEKLKEYFPTYRIARMDRDSTAHKGEHEKILKAFEKHEVDILIGTQMIAKGLDFPLVELVGILNADAGLMHQDYNAAKMTFDLLMQASGRSGRSEIKGEVIIQAFNPEHYVLKAVLKQDYNYFYNIEMKYRHRANYPPYSHIVALYLSDSSLQRLEKSGEILDQLFINCPYRIYPLMSLNKLQRTFRKRIILLDKDLLALLNYITKIVDRYLKNTNVADIKVDIDPNYLE